MRDPVANQLFLWATSDSQWLFGDTAHTCDIEGRASHYTAQDTFWKGHREHAPLAPTRGRFDYHASVPLTLHHHPWYHLPVGVVSVLSSGGDEGKLANKCKDAKWFDELEKELQSTINDLLDSETAEAPSELVDEAPA